MATRKKKQRLKNYLTFVMDHSASMSRIKSDVQRTFNSLLAQHQQAAKEEDQDTQVSLVDFSTTVKEVFAGRPIENVAPIVNYYLDDMTALLDGVGRAIEINDAMTDSEDDHVSHLIMVLTDGHENCSRVYNWTTLQSRIERMQARGNWTFVFQVPPGATSIFTARGIPAGNVREWEATTQGVEAAAAATSVGTQSFYRSRSAGKKAVNNFYTDLSDLKTSDLRKNLDDQQAFYQSYAVPKEVEIRSFVEAQTGKPYLSGSAFYQLTKPETIQWRKDVLIREKNKRAVWGGDEARKMIGLQPFTDCKVTPGNHANFDIFVQSTSTNRKLVRGTSVLVRK
jgi:hypothetical protein